MDVRVPSETRTRELERRILRLMQTKRCVTFLTIANVFPHHPWQSLFKALFALRSRNRVTLTPLRWDYEVTLREPADQDSAGRERRPSVGSAPASTGKGVATTTDVPAPTVHPLK